jgi:hypothetical protein
VNHPWELVHGLLCYLFDSSVVLMTIFSRCGIFL